MIRLNNIKIKGNYTEEEIINKALEKYKVNKSNVESAYIFKRSIDARDKSNVHYVYAVDVKLKKNIKVRGAEEVKIEQIKSPVLKRKSTKSPVIIGAGPAGLFAALTFVQIGLKPIVIEQGACVEDRIKIVDEFTKSGKLNTRTNIQFGEGGAGTFSDGKLNTGNTNVYSRKVLEEFVKFGAPKEILYVAKPHIGTDKLVTTIRNLREYVKSCGGEFKFNTKAMDFEIENGKIKSVITDKETINTDAVVLAIGHSARDTFKKLLELKVNMVPKNFALGVRIEHLQKDINLSQYGNEVNFKLPSAEYKLVYHAKNGRVCYTFCMCPGGQVMASTSQEGKVVTNGMSKFARDGENANSALLVNITPQDSKYEGPLCGMYLQEELEEKAFKLGGENYFAPVQRVEDYLNNVKSNHIGKVKPTYMPGVTLSNLNELFPEFVNETLKEALVELDHKLKGFADPDSIMSGVETRTSSPVQILRDKETLESNIRGFYPCGEGAGYAGGIMTAAIDGIKVATQIIEKE